MVKNKSYKEELKTLKEDFGDLKHYIDELSEALPVAICTLSSFWVIVDANKTVMDLTGYKFLEMVGQTADFIFGKNRILEETKQEAEKSGTVIGKEMTLTTRNQRTIPVNVSLVSRKDREENLIGYFLTIIDITETKKYQKDLKKRAKELGESRTALINILEDVGEARIKAEEEKNKTLAIINNFVDGLLVFDKENKLSLVSPQVGVFFGIKRKDIINRTISELTAFPAFKLLLKLVGPEVKEVFREELLIKKNLTLEVSTIPIMRGEEKFGTLVILHDITREKLIERMKTEFVSLAAHQLRTPLSAIKWTLRMLLDGDLGEITGEQKDFIKKTYKSNERMITLINSLLDVARIEEGRYIYRPILTEFEPVVQFIVDSCREEAGKKKLKIEFRKPEKQSPRVMLDVEKIRLAIQNLLDNAIKYTPEGGKVMISLKHSRKEIELSVKDSGVGIPKDQQERVFAKFFRGANVLRMETEGTGLGLFIARNIIEAHGGRIWFESEEGKGTTFHFILPVKEEFESFLKEF